MSVNKSKIISPTKNNKSIFYNANNKNAKRHNRSNSSLLNKNTTNSATRFNSTNRRINNFLNKKTTTLILYKMRIKCLEI